MDIAVEMSLYPLSDEYLPVIKGFIERLNTHPGLAVQTNAMSTQVRGEIGTVFAAIQQEVAVTFAGPQRAVLVMKVLGGGG
ncbi:MAG: thiamine-binding protein [Gammaproteobacteria bacterium]|nr:thiamine-binding protein [Gammaproteobacteria bacterium]